MRSTAGRGDGLAGQRKGAKSSKKHLVVTQLDAQSLSQLRQLDLHGVAFMRSHKVVIRTATGGRRAHFFFHDPVACRPKSSIRIYPGDFAARISAFSILCACPTDAAPFPL